MNILSNGAKVVIPVQAIRVAGGRAPSGASSTRAPVVIPVQAIRVAGSAARNPF